MNPGLSHSSSSHTSVVSSVFSSGTGTREWMLAVLVVQADFGGTFLMTPSNTTADVIY